MIVSFGLWLAYDQVYEFFQIAVIAFLITTSMVFRLRWRRLREKLRSKGFTFRK
jgi:hypothetical protein